MQAFALALAASCSAHAFDLISPADGETVNTLAVFDWEPRAGATSYTLLFFENDVEITRVTGIRESRVGIDESLGLNEGLTTHDETRRLTWQVRAILDSGSVASDQVFTVFVKDSSIEAGSSQAEDLPGLLRGLVRSEADASSIVDANVSVQRNGQTFTDSSDFRGEYLLILAPGSYVVSARSQGFVPTTAGTVTVSTGQTARAPDIEMEEANVPRLNARKKGAAVRAVLDLVLDR